MDLECPLIRFWSVCVDVEHQRIDVSLVYIPSFEIAANLEGVVRNCDPHKSEKSAREFYRVLTVALEEEMSKIKGEKETLKTLLFGDDEDGGNAVNEEQVEQPQDEEMKDAAKMEEPDPHQEMKEEADDIVTAPLFTKTSRGELKVAHNGEEHTFKDVVLTPDGATEWNWKLDGTRHEPGITVKAIEMNHLMDADHVILTKGVDLVLQTTEEAVASML